MEIMNLTENVLMIFRRIANSLETIANNKPKKIDWEQRRYEIAKDVMNAICSAPGNCQGQEWPLENACISVNVADALIKELKGEPDEA